MRFILLALFIQKYGGTSVGNLERIRAVANHLASVFQAGHKLVVVVSAMGQQTDELLELALALNEMPPQREVDMLLSAGERISMSLLAIALSNMNISTVSFTGSQSGILTDNTFGNARIIKILGDRIRKALEQNKLVIVAGFQGMSELEKEITTLGRGGSDLTAIALAHALSADKCQIFKDVDGVCTADPRIVPSAKLLTYLSWDSLSHLTWFGSGVVHNRGVHLAKKYRIPLEIRSSFNLNNPGTEIGGHKNVESAVVYAITSKDGLTWLTIENLPKLHTTETFKILTQLGEQPIYFQSHQQGENLVTDILVSSKAVPNLTKTLNEANKNLSIKERKESLSCITLVGDGFWQDTSILDRSLKLLPLNPILVDCKNSFLNFVVGKEETNVIIELFHKEFLES